jgi:membrane-associated phospholipid phosphatase
MLSTRLVRPATTRKDIRNKNRRQPLQLEALEERCLLTGDVVLEWNHIALDAVAYDSTLGAQAHANNPGASARALAIVQSAVFDAVNSIAGAYDPYLIQVHAQRPASIDAAAAQAAHDTLANIFPEYVGTLDTRLATDLGNISDTAARDAGVLVGKTVASAMLAARANDPLNDQTVYVSPNQPGKWQPDPLHPTQTAWGNDWSKVPTFALRSATQFPVPPPPSLGSNAYTIAYNEVKNYGGDGVTTPTLRTPEETTIGIFWGYDGSPGLGTPPRFYNQIAETLAVQEGNTEVQNARFFALINLALADSGIAAWGAKYQYDFWRPVTAIRAAGTDHNSNTIADPTWAPLGAPKDNGGGTNFTPPFPSYASGHATFGGALFEMMARYFNTNNISFTLHSDEFNGITTDQNGNVRPVVTRSYTSFSQAAEENGQSRIYLGIHWSFDKVQGIAQGKKIADYIFQNYLLPRGLVRTHVSEVERMRAMISPTTGTVMLATTDGKPMNPRLGTGHMGSTMPTTAISVHDTPTLVADLIARMDRGIWDGTKRGGKTLDVWYGITMGDVLSIDKRV